MSEYPEEEFNKLGEILDMIIKKNIWI